MVLKPTRKFLRHRIQAMATSLLVLVLAVTVAAGIASAQQATLGGTVMDETGAVIPGAVISATGLGTGVVTRATANNAGNYQFPSLSPGEYRVSATTPGFTEVVYDPVLLNVSAQVRRNFTLTVSEVATVVEVAASAESPLMASGAVVGGILPRQQIEDLPLVDRSAANLALTQAGVTGGIGEGVSVAGADTLGLLVTVDGISVSNTRITRAGGLHSFQLSQSVDLVEEVKVTSSPADAEFGRSVGRVEMVTRSGTNQFHGSVTNGFRNTVLNANTYWNNLAGRDKQVLKRNQYAARIGGPIVRNQTFFFFLYDGNRQRGAQTAIHEVLTAPARQGIYRFFPDAQNQNFSSSDSVIDSNGNPVQPADATGPLQSVNILSIEPNRGTFDPTGLIKKYMDLTPLPNDWLTGDGLNTAGYAWQAPEYANKDQFTIKVDHTFNQSHMLNATFTHEKQKYTNAIAQYPTSLLSDGTLAHGYNDVPSKFLSVNLTSTLTPSLVNMFKAGFQYPNMNQIGGTRAYPELYPRQGDQLYDVTFQTFDSPLPGNVDSQLINPVYTIANNTSWLRGQHAFKWGFQFDHMESNSFNINNRYTPRINLGEGVVQIENVDDIAGLVSQNEGMVEDMIIDFTGSVDSVEQGFKTINGTDLTWVNMPNQRFWNQRSLGFYFKDDWKLAPNVTLNLGLRWDWTGPPSEQFGRTTGPENGFAGYFGISGTGYDALWKPGSTAGSLTKEITIGGNSANPDHMIHENYLKGFGPAVGLSWSIPYWGQDKTVFRAGYQISRPMAQSFLTINGAVGDIATTATEDATTLTFLNDVKFPLVPTTEPLELQPINSKQNRLQGYDPYFQPPVVQNYNASLERQLTNSTSVSVRYVGNKSTHQNSRVDFNEANVFENGIWEAANITAAGGDAPLFDTLLMGVYVKGAGTVDGTTLTGSEALRAYSSTRSYFYGNNAYGFATWINTNLALQPSATAERGGIITQAGLPANFVVVNPQYSGVRLQYSGFNRRYDSLILELNRRTTNGWGYQINLTSAKDYRTNGVNRNFRDWSEDRSVGGQLYSVKFSGTYELPFGPGKPVNFAGVAGKILGGWQLGGFLTVNSGDRLSFSASGNPTGNSQWAVATGDFPEDPGELVKTGDGGVYYLSGFSRVDDPYFCQNITTEQGAQGRCNMYTQSGIPLVNPAQGEKGNFNPVTNWRGPGLVNLDMNLVKRFDVTERVSAELRLDAISMPNNAHFGNPSTSLSSTSFGRISEPRAGGNANTSPTSYYGNRIFVINARVSF